MSLPLAIPLPSSNSSPPNLHRRRLRPSRTQIPIGNICQNPERRLELAAQRDPNAPQFVYHLYVAILAVGEPVDRRLLRTYWSPGLAKHDALCWVLHEGRKAGARLPYYFADEKYERKMEGRCCRVATADEIVNDLKKRF